MIYLALMVIVATIGIGSLVWQQRRQQAHMDSVAGFNEALKAISPESERRPLRNTRRPAPRPPHSRTPGRPIPLDDRQRAQARARLEQRRRIEAHKRAATARAANARYSS